MILQMDETMTAIMSMVWWWSCPHNLNIIHRLSNEVKKPSMSHKHPLCITMHNSQYKNGNKWQFYSEMKKHLYLIFQQCPESKSSICNKMPSLNARIGKCASASFCKSKTLRRYCEILSCRRKFSWMYNTLGRAGEESEQKEQLPSGGLCVQGFQHHSVEALFVAEM